MRALLIEKIIAKEDLVKGFLCFDSMSHEALLQLYTRLEVKY
jgi:hypothetical protein